MRPRPAYVVRTTRARAEISRLELDDRIRFGLRLDALTDDFFAPLDGAPLWWRIIRHAALE